MNRERWIIVTTINLPTKAIYDLAKLVPEWNLLVVGDRKTPATWRCDGARFLSVDEQLELGFGLSHKSPFNHYVRKNIGYLYAVQNGAKVILETDDDNLPYDWYPGEISQTVKARSIQKKGWENVYAHFSESRIWPRGFPLEFINDSFRQKGALGATEEHHCAIQQYLADDNPDVDAVFRLTNEGSEFFKGEDVVLGNGVWCPFNSQNTLWFPEAFPYLYLPCTATFRMTDIWRSFVAQMCLYATGGKLAFRCPSMFQKRNEHSLIRDFADEVSGYLNNPAIMVRLDALNLQADVPHSVNLRRCYSTMVEGGFLGPEEMDLLDCWAMDFEAACQAGGHESFFARPG